MCGIILLIGKNATSRIQHSLLRIKHRGPNDSHIWMNNQIAIGFTRLAINGSLEKGRQPYEFEDLIGAINGEIYNHIELESLNHIPFNECDTHIVLPLFKKFGDQFIHYLDGFYSGIIFHKISQKLFCFRDHIGKKPLFIGRSESEIFVTSELKAFDQIDWFMPVPLGFCSIDISTGKITELSNYEKSTFNFNKTNDDIKRSTKDLEIELFDLLQKSVKKRLPSMDQPLGVFLSGGLDSSIIASLVSKYRDDTIYFTLGNQNHLDRKFVEILVKSIGLKNLCFVDLPNIEELPNFLKKVVYATESFNPSIISNGLATFLLSEAANKIGIKVVLTGEGADELFGGYHIFKQNDPWSETREQLIKEMNYTELRRLDMSSMAHAIEARCPFLDLSIRSFSNQLEFQNLYDQNVNKVILRNTFKNIIPSEILNRKKTSFDVGSGLRQDVVKYLRQWNRSERDELKLIWKKYFKFDSSHPYFHAYPTFDHLIEVRGEKHK
jgi:asparagine synthase (glutamine-hydrolysing)